MSDESTVAHSSQSQFHQPIRPLSFVRDLLLKKTESSRCPFDIRCHAPGRQTHGLEVFYLDIKCLYQVS